MEALPKRKARTKKILAALARAYPHARCLLEHRTPMQLLVAVILSAQCTDEQVNKVAADLFKNRKTAADFARLTPARLETKIYSTGFYRNKAKNILGAAKRIVEEFDGQVPRDMDDLLSLPGVARKTANVVRQVAFNQADGIVVDTHVKRIAGRLALSDQSNPEKIEKDLMEAAPKADWGRFGFLFQAHGRARCTARKPDCPHCPIEKHCPWPEKTVQS